MENVPLWHERDISHSSAERVVLPDAFLALDYMLDRFCWIMEGLVVHADRMRRNLDASHGLFFSHRLLLSVPNQERLPFNRGQFPFHVRHYTPAELDALLRGAGWVIGRLWSQPSRTAPDILPGAGGYTLIAECLRAGP